VANRCTVEGSHLGSLYGCAATGRRLWVSGIFTVCIRGGRIVEAWYQLDTLEVARQIGFPKTPSVAVLQNGTRGL
jgi:predicted ester cyclase